MRYSLQQVREFDQTLPFAVAIPALSVNDGYVTLRKISDEEYIAIWAENPGNPIRAGVLNAQDYADLCARLIDHQPDDYGYALAIVDYAKYQFDAQGKAYLPESGSDYDFAD